MDSTAAQAHGRSVHSWQRHFDEYIWFDETSSVDPLPGLPDDRAAESEAAHPLSP